MDQISVLNLKQQLAAIPLKVVDPETQDEVDLRCFRWQGLSLTNTEQRMLCLIRRYSEKLVEHKRDRWIFGPTLRVLLHELIQVGFFPFIEVPSLEWFEGRRKFLHISHEATKCLNHLVEIGVLNILKSSSGLPVPPPSYKLSSTAPESMILSPKDFAILNSVILDPDDGSLLQAKVFNEDYCLYHKDCRKFSSITLLPEAYYVVSGYLPQSLQRGGGLLSSNAKLVDLLPMTDITHSSLRHLFLISPCLLLSDYIPYGSSMISNLNSLLGPRQNSMGEWFPTGSGSPSGYTIFSLLDAGFDSGINLEGVLHLYGRGQSKEAFGLTLMFSGYVYLGVQVESINRAPKERTSLMDVVFVLPRLEMNSSYLLDSLLTEDQRELLNLVYPDHAHQREKIILVIAHSFNPPLPAEKLLSAENRAYIDTVFGCDVSIHQLSSEDVFLNGHRFYMLVGPNAKFHEQLMCSFLQFRSISCFLDNFHGSLSSMLQEMSKIRTQISSNHPSQLPALSLMAHNIVLCRRLVSLLQLSFENLLIPPEPQTVVGRELYEKLMIGTIRIELSQGLKEATGIVGTLEKEIQGFQDSLRTRFSQLEIQTKQRMISTVEDSDEASTLRRIEHSLCSFVALSAGVLAVHFLHLMTGDWTVLDQKWAQPLRSAVQAPMVWLFVALALWALLYGAFVYLAPLLGSRHRVDATLFHYVSVHSTSAAIEAFLRTRKVQSLVKWGKTTKVQWRERVGRWPCDVSMSYTDAGLIGTISFSLSDDRDGSISRNLLQSIVMQIKLSELAQGQTRAAPPPVPPKTPRSPMVAPDPEVAPRVAERPAK